MGDRSTAALQRSSLVTRHKLHAKWFGPPSKPFPTWPLAVRVVAAQIKRSVFQSFGDDLSRASLRWMRSPRKNLCAEFNDRHGQVGCSGARLPGCGKTAGEVSQSRLVEVPSGHRFKFGHNGASGVWKRAGLSSVQVCARSW